jgi:hypothetical protein
MVALIYAKRLQGRSPALMADPAGTFLASLILADKMLCDATYTNSDWAEFSDHRYTAEDINALERQVLTCMDYNLSISLEEYDSFLQELDVLLCLQQISWSSLSYRDLTALLHFPTLVGQTMLPHRNLGAPTMDAVFLLLKTVGVVASTYLASILVAAVMLHTFAPVGIPQPGVSANVSYAGMPVLLPGQKHEPYFVSFLPQMAARRLLALAAQHTLREEERKKKIDWWNWKACGLENGHVQGTGTGNVTIPLIA